MHQRARGDGEGEEEEDVVYLEEAPPRSTSTGLSPRRVIKDPKPSTSTATATAASSNASFRKRRADDIDDSKKPFCLRPTVIVHPLLLLVQLIFSGYHILGFKAVNVDPQHAEQVALVFAFYREITASIFMLILAFQAARLGGYSLLIRKKDIPKFIVLGLFSFGNVVGVVEALTKVSATNVAVMQPAIPVFTMMLSVLFRMEKLTIIKATGLAMAVAGAITIEVVKPGGHLGGRSAGMLVAGNIIIILQCLSMASLLIMQKFVLELYHPTVVTTWYYLVGSLLTVLVCLGKNIPGRLYTFGGSTQPWIALSYAALLGTFFNYNAYAWAGTVISPAMISIYSTLQPIGTAVLSVIFLEEYPTVPEILCGILVIAGLLLTLYGKHMDDKARLARESRRRASSAERELPLVQADGNQQAGED